MEKPTEEAPKEEKKKESRKEKESLALRILNSKVMIWATIIGTILGIIGFLQALVSERNKSELSVSLNYHNREMIVGQSDTLLPLVKPGHKVASQTQNPEIKHHSLIKPNSPKS